MQGDGFVKALWQEANTHFKEVAPLAKKQADGGLCGVWGLMTDFSRSFLPWENDFSQGLYLAGVECVDDARPPAEWSRWEVPGFEYLRVINEGEHTFTEMIRFLSEQQITLAGAVQDFICPSTGNQYMLFPIRRL